MLGSSILCPVDLSEASRGALQFAAAIAEHFFAGLTVATIADPLPAGQAGTDDSRGTLVARQRDLVRFLNETFPTKRPIVADVHLVVAMGKPAGEIHRIALDRHADLIVMSTHGAAGARGPFFGSTTEAVLRNTQIPVLVTPARSEGPASLDDLTGTIHTVLAPVDLTVHSQSQVKIACGLAEAFQTSLLLLHVLEPPDHGAVYEMLSMNSNARRRQAADALDELLALLPKTLQAESVIAEGDPAEQIAALARAHRVGAIVMGLHSARMPGRQMGSVTYRVLCQTAVPVLALPPRDAAAAARHTDLETAASSVPA